MLWGICSARAKGCLRLTCLVYLGGFTVHFTPMLRITKVVPHRALCRQSITVVTLLNRPCFEDVKEAWRQRDNYTPNLPKADLKASCSPSACSALLVITKAQLSVSRGGRKGHSGEVLAAFVSSSELQRSGWVSSTYHGQSIRVSSKIIWKKNLISKCSVINWCHNKMFP